MTREDYVTYEQAQLLKELDFDWECYDRYNVDKKIEPNIIFNHIKVDANDLCFNVNGRCIGDISAPTLAQAQKWLFEKFGIWIQIERDSIESTMFTCEINHADEIYQKCVGIFENPFDALSEGINEALELLKEQNNA